MSAANFTPGPWLISDNDGRFVYALNAEGFNRFYLHVHGPHTPTAELDAVARLIAAAPDLLAACENARDMLATDRQAFVDGQCLHDIRTEDPIAHGLVAVEDGVWITPEDAEALRDYDRALSLIDAAVAKATGRAV